MAKAFTVYITILLYSNRRMCKIHI